MTETIDTANLRALAENIIAADGPIWWIEQDFRAVKEVLDATIDDARFVAAANPTTIIALLDRLAAAEARNATLTDDAAHADRYAEQLGRELAKATSEIQALTDDAARYRFLRRCKGQEHDPLFTVQHEIDGTLWGGDLDVAIDEARAAASISTKEGDGNVDQ